MIGAARPTRRTTADFRAARIARLRADIADADAALARISMARAAMAETLNGLVLLEAAGLVSADFSADFSASQPGQKRP